MKIFAAIGLILFIGVGIAQTNISQSKSLRDLADARGFYIGTAVDSEYLEDATYRETVSREFNMLVPEWEMKMSQLEPQDNLFVFIYTDRVLAFAQAHGMVVRGHTLIWHEATPDWLNAATFTREEAIETMCDLITTVMWRYKGRVMAWDVVNEALNGKGRLRKSVWRELIGDDYIALAFTCAHEADPDALLFYNDTDVEGINTKSDGMYVYLKDLVERGVPVHGVGLQMHTNIDEFGNESDLSFESLRANIERFGELGLQVHITEMDVRTLGCPEPEASARQADIYGGVLRTCLETEACTAFLTWGFTDLHSWIREYLGEEGEYPLPFDEAYQPKPAYHALVDAFLAAQ